MLLKFQCGTTVAQSKGEPKESRMISKQNYWTFAAVLMISVLSSSKAMARIGEQPLKLVDRVSYKKICDPSAECSFYSDHYIESLLRLKCGAPPKRSDSEAYEKSCEKMEKNEKSSSPRKLSQRQP
jgi:hypothetical protein